MSNRSLVRMLAIGAIAAQLAGCAVHAPNITPPRLDMPAIVHEPCSLPRLPAGATMADLEQSYAARGAEIALCDARRDLAVTTALAQQELIDRWMEERPATWPPWRRRE